jgi:hypothetical protein
LKIGKRIVLIITLIKNLFKIYLFQQENLKGRNKEIPAKKTRTKCLSADFQAMKA